MDDESNDRPDQDINETIRAEVARRRQIESALEDSEALYHSLVEHLPISVYRIDLEGRITFGNSAYLQDIGRPLDDLRGKTVFDIFPEEVARKYDADDRSVIRTGQVLHDIEEHRVRGKTLYVEVLKSLVHNRDGRPIGVQGLYWDVTARKSAEERLQKMMAELERSNKELQQFAAVASHDMHAPLRRIVTLSGMIRQQYENKLGADGRELLELVVSSAEHMQDLIDDLLAHSRVGAAHRRLEPVDCGWAVNKVLDHLAGPIHDSGAEVQVGRLPSVVANPVELVQLFQNLIGNAVKYCTATTPHVNITASLEDDEWLFCLKDNGIGIAEEQHDKIFETFRRLHGEEAYTGTGIGLATCKKIVESLGGRIWVESSSGEGSCFMFRLPQGEPTQH